MPTMTPVDHDPFAGAGPTLTPVDHDPFADASGNFEGASNAAASGFASGVPIVGPALNAALDRGVAGIGSVMSGKPYADVLTRVQAQEAADNTAHPLANKIAGVAGGIAGALPAVVAAPAAFGAEGGALTAGQMLRGAASGAVIGGADAGVRGGNPIEGAVLGAAGGAAAPALGAVVGKAMPGGAATPKAPSADALRAQSGADYAAARDLGVHFTADAVGGMSSATQDKLNDLGILPILAPKTHAILGQLADPPAGATVPFQGLEAARRAFGFAAKDIANPTEQKAASAGIEAIDNLFAAGESGSIARGAPDDVAKLATLAQEARANWAAGSRVDQLTGMGEAAESRAAAANSGQNIGNATRQRVAGLLLNRGGAGTRGFTDDEISSLRKVVDGTPYQNATRYVGNLLGGGGGLGGIVGSAIGHGAAGMPGAIGVPLVGHLAKRLSNSSTVNALNDVAQATARRSPLFEQMMATHPVPDLPPPFTPYAAAIGGALSRAVPITDNQGVPTY